MEKYRIDLERVFSKTVETMDNTNYKGTEADLKSYFEDLMSNDERIKNDYCKLRLVENETDAVVYEVEN